MNQSRQMWGAWCGPLCLIVFFAGVVFFLKLFPPFPPRTTPDELVALYGQDPQRFLAGSVCLLFGGGLFIPFAAAIAVQVKKIEGENPFLTYMLLMGSALVAMEIILASWFFAALGFSPHSPDVTQALSDIALLMFVWPNTVTMVMAAAIGFAILSDAGAIKIFPRWVGFLNIALTLLWIPSNLTVFFKSGLVAWNGLLPFWIPAAEFGVWLLVMFFGLRRAIRIERPAAQIR